MAPRRYGCGGNAGETSSSLTCTCLKKDGIETIIELLSHTPGMRIIAMSGGGQTKRLDLLGNVAAAWIGPDDRKTLHAD